MFLEEGKNFLTDLCRVRLQSKVARVIKHDFGLGIIALVSLSPRGDEERIIFPHIARVGGRYFRKNS